MPIILPALTPSSSVVPASAIGPVYDLMLATRDGSTLPCKNKDGQVLNLSQVAYTTSIDRQKEQHEETELQHKDQLVQLSSSNLIDREFDQWPQVTQGDWSGGGLQRILTGSSPATSFVPASDPTRYWDGEGLLWPIFDYLPQKPFHGPGQSNGPGAVINSTVAGCTGGFVYVSGINAEPGYAIASVNGADSAIDFIYADGDASILNPFGAGIVTDAMCIGGGAIYAVARPDATHIRIYRINATTTTTLAVDASLDTGLAPNSIIFAASVDAREVGNHFFVALGVTYYSAVLGMKSALVIQDWSQPAGPTAAISIDLPNAHGAQLGGSVVTDCKILGDSVYIALSDGSTSNKGYDAAQMQAGAGSRTAILQYSIPSGTWTTVAVIENASGAHFCPVAGSLFVLAYSSESGNTTLSIDMYLLQGGNLQHIGPVFFPSSAWISCSKVAGWGSYAFFALAQNSLTVNAYHIFAYDVLRGRFFRVHTRNNVVSTNIMVGHMLGVFGSQKRTDAAYTNGIFSQFGIAYDSTVLVQGTGADSFATELYFNVTPCTSFGGVKLIPPPIQQGSDINSSIIDFTSAQPKLFRQVVVTLQEPGLPASPIGTVRIKVWLDRDPAALTAIPDFDTGVVAAGVNGGVAGQTQIKLLINRIARKLVYEIITDGGRTATNNVFVSTPKVSDIAVQAATGWTRTMVLDLADNAIVNTKGPGDTVWSHQQPPGQPVMDATAGYNFLRQLWRLRGGEVTATFPNGDDPANWLLQDIHWDSPKPYGVSFRGDMRSQLGYICTVKLREDV